MLKNKLKRKILQEASYASGKYLISPEIVSLTLTYQCNFRCNSCTVWRMNKYPELSKTQWLNIIDDLKKTLSPETSIELSGGEPLLKKDLTYSATKNLREFFKNVGINSNGSLIDEETILKLKENNITFVKISLYSINNKIHDALRGFANASEQAKNAIELLQKHKIKTDIGVLITAKNISTIPDLIKYYSKTKYSHINIVLQPLDEPIGLAPIIGKDKIQTINNLWPDKKCVLDFFNLLKKNNFRKIKNSEASLNAIEKFYLNHDSALKHRCFAGQRSLVINPDGKISMCYKGKIIGNMAEENLQKILSSKKALDERLSFKKCDKHCRIIGCNFSKTIPEILKIK